MDGESIGVPNRIGFSWLISLIHTDDGKAALNGLASASIEELAILSSEISAQKAIVARASDFLHAECERRFGDDAKKTRLAENKDTGTIRLENGEYAVVCTAPKKVDWDQKKLKELWDRILAAGDKPDEYMHVEYKISEKAYSAWPDFIQSQFEPARMVRIGKQNFEFERK